MKYGVIYARYSSSNQREESIEGQIRECKEFASRNEIEIIEIYIDRAMSAKTDDRPEFIRMIKDSNKQSFNHVIVYQLDRFSRNRYDSATYKAKLKKNGVSVLSAKENITDDPSSILLESMLEGMAEYYSVELAQKVKRGMTENILKGKWSGGSIPLGYRLNENKQLEIDNHAAESIRILFDMYEKGYTMADIARHLNVQGYRNSKGKEFKRNSFTFMLKNEIYIGKLSWGDVISDITVPAIISERQFYEVQRLRKNRKGSHNAISGTYALTSKIVCGHCSGNMVGVSGTSRHGTTHYYYTCYNKKSKKCKCESKNINRDKLEKFILDITREMLSDPESIRMIAHQAVEANKKYIEENTLLKQLEIRIKDIKRKLHNCEKAIMEGLISETISNSIRQLEQELKQAEKDYHVEKVMNNPVEITEDIVVFFLTHIKSKKAIIDTFINKIVIDNEHIEVHYNYNQNLPKLDNVRVLRGSDNVKVVNLIHQKKNHTMIYYQHEFVYQCSISMI